MKSRDFCYWLQGVFEVGELKTLNEKQRQQIKNHLNLVFVHEIDPMTEPDPEKAQVLNDIHGIGGTVIGPNGEEMIARC